MTAPKSTLSVLAYFVVGLLVLIVAVQVLGVILSLITKIVAAALSIALVLAVGYVVYLLVRSAIKDL